jgi:hypothetical protein
MVTNSRIHHAALAWEEPLLWQDFHSDPRMSYYLSLRRGYAHSAAEAHAKLKRMDAMIARLQDSSREHVWSDGVVALMMNLISRARRRFIEAFAWRVADQGTRRLR